MEWERIEDKLPPFEELVLVVNTEYRCYDLAILSNFNGMQFWTGDRVITWHDIGESYGKPTHWKPLTPPSSA